MNNIVGLVFLIILCNNSHFSQSRASVFNPKFTFLSLEQAETKDPEEVRHLKISKKNLTGFPQNITKYKNLESLSLQGLKLSTIPDEISSFEKLTYLDISKNKISTLPESFCKLLNLEILVLNRNPLLFLPHCLGKMQKLKALDLYDTEVSNLPDTMDGLEQLKHVDFQGIQLRQEEIDSLKKRFPEVKFVFDPPCNCFK